MTRSLILASLLVIQAGISAQEDPGIQFEVKTLGGRVLDQDDFRDNVLLIDYWGTWCPPCRKAVPFLEELYGKYKHHGLEIIGLNYEQGPGDHAAKVREFAATNHITYPLALGTQQQKRLVDNFQGYPTMLFLRKGLVLDHQEVGFSSAAKPQIEGWVRRALGLDGQPGPTETVEDALPRSEPVPEPEELASGVIFRPGEGDRGFTFAAEDVDGKLFDFATLRGRPVILALTSTWDREAVATSELLQALHTTYNPKGSLVLAAFMEMSRNRKTKIETIIGFRETHGLSYPMIPAGISLQKKIHLFSGLPLFLVFDQAGVLVLREAGIAEAIAERIRAKLDDLL